MEQVVAVARTLRIEHQFRGYIHLKTIPEASPALIEEAGRWADRISINIELPTEVGARAARAGEELREHAGGDERNQRSHRAGESGAAGEQESADFRAGGTEHADDRRRDRYARRDDPRRRRLRFTRSRSCGAFTTRPSARFPMLRASCRLIAPPLVREHRLYQADWLVRFYGFEAQELTTATAPNLDLALIRSSRGRCAIGTFSRST